MKIKKLKKETKYPISDANCG